MAKPRLSRGDWITAALSALAAGGVSAVAVDPLAGRLGVTRGSFYWHFADRRELLLAALLWWEQAGTHAVIDRVADIADPRERLRELFRIVLTEDPTEGLEPVLVAHAGDPEVAPVLHRVTERRLAFLTEVHIETGLPPVQARHQSLVTYAAYVGWTELRRAAPTVAPEFTGAVAYLVDYLVPA